MRTVKRGMCRGRGPLSEPGSRWGPGSLLPRLPCQARRPRVLPDTCAGCPCSGDALCLGLCFVDQRPACCQAELELSVPVPQDPPPSQGPAWGLRGHLPPGACCRPALWAGQGAGRGEPGQEAGLPPPASPAVTWNKSLPICRPRSLSEVRCARFACPDL